MYLIDINVSAKLDKFPSLPFQDIKEQVAQEGNNRSPEEQLNQGINIIRNSKRPLVELLKLLELELNQNRFLHNKNAL